MGVCDMSGCKTNVRGIPSYSNAGWAYSELGNPQWRSGLGSQIGRSQYDYTTDRKEAQYQSENPSGLPFLLGPILMAVCATCLISALCASSQTLREERRCWPICNCEVKRSIDSKAPLCD